jgi:hypothetical protein
MIDKINGHAITRSTSGDPIVGYSHNYLLTSSERKYFRRAMFEILCKRRELTLSYALTNYSCDLMEQDPAKNFTEIFHPSQKEFYSKEQENLLLKSANDAMIRLQRDGLRDEDIGSMEKCAISYAARHDLSQSIHDYCFAMDPRLKYSCGSLERLLQNPCVGFYSNILKLPTMSSNSKFFDKKLHSVPLSTNFCRFLNRETF